MTTKHNPWNHIPLEDYETHMSHDNVGQQQLLSWLTKKYLELLNPVNCLFLGVAGGNGLEHIDNNRVESVYAIDINQAYLEKAEGRFGGKIKSLRLLNIDISQNSTTICKADLIWAALILEYTGIHEALSFAKNNISKTGQLVITIQSNNGVTSVSSTGIESLKKLGTVFKVVDRDDLISQAKAAGFEPADAEENFLPNGKSLLTFRFAYTSATVI